MKRLVFSLFALFISLTSSAQSPVFEYTGRITPVARHETLHRAGSISDISPEFWHRMAVDAREYHKLRGLAQMNQALHFSLVSIKSTDAIYPNESYEKVIDYISVEISARYRGQTRTVKSNGRLLTESQQKTLQAADFGSNLQIKVLFRYKGENKHTDTGIHEALGVFTVIPPREAEYPGGYNQISQHFNEQVTYKRPEIFSTKKTPLATLRFVVDETGEVVEEAIIDASDDPKMDKLLLEAMKTMPKWRPARNAEGVKVRQEFSFSFPYNGGC